jgi:uncharacterized membrane protein YgcG
MPIKPLYVKSYLAPLFHTDQSHIRSHLRPLLRLPTHPTPPTEHFTANPSLLHHLPQSQGSHASALASQASSAASSGAHSGTSGAGRGGFNAGGAGSGGYTVSNWSFG